MALPLSSVTIEEKNKLATDSVFLIALSIIVPGLSDPLRVIRTDSDVVWAGETWIAFPFEIEEVSDQSKGEVPQVVVRISNADRAIEAFIQDYDTYVKTYGFSPMGVYIYIVNSKAIALDPYCDPEVEHYFELKQPKITSKWVSFTLGASNPFMRRFPASRVLKNTCRYRVFKGDRCGYVGAETSCNRTLVQCRLYNNSGRFGGFPGVGQGGVIVAGA
jgi:lambda family phage minor tail protein L